MPEKPFERSSRHLSERNQAWKELARFKKERDQLLCKLAEIMDKEAEEEDGIEELDSRGD